MCVYHIPGCGVRVGRVLYRLYIASCARVSESGAQQLARSNNSNRFAFLHALLQTWEVLGDDALKFCIVAASFFTPNVVQLLTR